MSGKDICNLLKQFRKELADKNGIEYEIRDCSHGDDCKGTCPFCEMETEQLYSQLREKENNGETVDWSTSVELPDCDFITKEDINICFPKHLPEPCLEIVQGLYPREYDGMLKGDIDVEPMSIFHGQNQIQSYMNELQGDVSYEPEYPETPYGELCEFFAKHSSSSESLNDEEITIDKIKEVRRRTSRGMAESKEALKKFQGNVDDAVDCLNSQPIKHLMGKMEND